MEAALSHVLYLWEYGQTDLMYTTGSGRLPGSSWLYFLNLHKDGISQAQHDLHNERAVLLLTEEAGFKLLGRGS